MDFDCSSLVDAAYDYDDMVAVINCYNKELNSSQHYTHSRLLEILSNGEPSLLRSSLRTQYDSIKTSFQYSGLIPSSPTSALDDMSAIVPFPFADAVPLEIWEDIFDVMAHCACLVSCCVCHVWCAWITPRTHTHLVLSLPDGWPRFLRSRVKDDPLVLQRFASVYELDMCSMIVSSSLCHVIRGVRYSNWLLSPYNCFLHLLDNLEVVVIEGTAQLDHDCIPPTIPCPFLLPATIKELRCSKVSFNNYSLEGCLSPSSCLERLTVESIEAGHLISYFRLLLVHTLIADGNRDVFRESVGLTSFRCPHLFNTYPPSLRYLKLDLMYDVFGSFVEQFGAPDLSEDGFALLHQLFHANVLFASILDAGETFPLQMRTSSLRELDLRVGSQYFAHLQFFWCPLASTLTKLTLRIPHGDTGGMGAPITLAGLNVLRTLVICCDHQIVQRSITVMSTWDSPCHSSPESVFKLWLHSESPSPNLHVRGFTLPFLRHRFLASATNGMHAFRGFFLFSLRGYCGYPINDLLCAFASGIVKSVWGDPALSLRGVECGTICLTDSSPEHFP
ncbi:hypothetical protein ARMSODRAFT_1022523 [Armillaria solidipes]|uniref:F-box domain-containing protein n=1 Tax=Armillaria solidipes TaxID=1076256 RepID=A0A2H3BGD1_9AGAR|nr:hypothetical protein ARMSODRAFT_1022523 [Armillaria solidipes]